MNRIFPITIITLFFNINLSADDFIGSERCKICHKSEYEVFSKTAHKNTSRSLNNEQKRNKDCLMCHSMDTEGKYMEIGCEACHGSGKYYSQDYIMKDKELSRLIGLKKPNENTCKKCHTTETPKIIKMNIKEGMKKIEHKREKTPNKEVK